ncbi:cobalamin biosynthesis protein CbiG, partial [Modestobacter versicolor]
MITVGVGASTGVTVEEVLAAVDAVLPPGARGVQLATLTRRGLEP